jgi:hypothetical protein
MAIQLPEIIEMNAYNHNFNNYYNAIYNVFVRDFVIQKPIYRGTRLGLKKHPIIDSKEYTFYHMTHSGDIENERIPDFRRMERIPWPKPIIDNSIDQDLRVWENVRRGTGGTKTRILIWHVSEDYLVVLDKRQDFILPWTAYCGLSERKKKNLNAEYNAYINAEAAKN